MVLGLKDVHVPASADWWPPSPAAIALLVIALCILLSVLVFIIKRRRFHAAKRFAVAQLKAHSGNQLEKAQAAHQLLKRLAKHYYGERYAALHGEQWLAFLDKVCTKHELTNNRLMALYQANNELSDPVLLAQLTKAIANFNPRGKVNV